MKPTNIIPSPDSAVRPLGDVHFTVRELCQRLTDGFAAPDHRRALAHFGVACSECWQVLLDIAEQEIVPRLVEGKWESVWEEGAPVRLALRRCLDSLSAIASRAEQGPRFTRLGLMHRQTLIEACTETESEKKAFAFCRLVLEESRSLALQDPSRLVHGVRSTMAELEGTEALSDLWGRPSLLGLGSIYLADDYRVAGDLDQAHEHLRKAEGVLAVEFPEIHACYHEIEADLARTQGDYFGALDDLDLAEKQLEACPIPGRRAATRLRRGLVHMRLGNSQRAVDEFTAAITDTPPDAQSHTQLEAWHHIATIEVCRRRFKAAKRALERAEPLYQNHASGFILAQRNRLRGIVHLEFGEHARAEQRLRQAQGFFAEHHLVLDEAQVLGDLGRLYLKTRCSGKRLRTATRFQELMEDPKTLALPKSQRLEMMGRAAKNGLLIPLTDVDEQQVN